PGKLLPGGCLIFWDKQTEPVSPTRAPLCASSERGRRHRRPRRPTRLNTRAQTPQTAATVPRTKPEMEKPFTKTRLPGKGVRSLCPEDLEDTVSHRVGCLS